MKTKLLFIIISIAFALTTQAQLKVYNTGNIGISATNPLSNFAIGGDGTADTKVYIYNSNTSTSYKAFRVDQALPTGTYIYGMFSSIMAGPTTGWPIAIYGSGYRGSGVTSSGRSIGVKGVAGNTSSGYNYGLYGVLDGIKNGAAVYGVTPGKGDLQMTGFYAGYFRGNVKIENDLNVVGVFTNSDINLKKDIVFLEGNNIAKIKQLQAIKYKLKTPIELNAFSKEVTDTAKFLMSEAELNDPLYTKELIGISAQEIQKVYPSIVKEEDNGYLSVNYIELIPILLEAIKEQQASIDELRKIVDKMSSMKSE